MIGVDRVVSRRVALRVVVAGVLGAPGTRGGWGLPEPVVVDGLTVGLAQADDRVDLLTAGTARGRTAVRLAAGSRRGTADGGADLADLDASLDAEDLGDGFGELHSVGSAGEPGDRALVVEAEGEDAGGEGLRHRVRAHDGARELAPPTEGFEDVRPGATDRIDLRTRRGTGSRRLRGPRTRLLLRGRPLWCGPLLLRRRLR